MNLWQEYRQPSTISEAIQDLTNAPQPALPIAGGSDLLLDIRQGRHAPVHTLIDLKGIPEMNLIEVRGDYLFIGASVSITQILNNPLANQHAQALVEACNLIAGPQVRNIATLGGNVAHALPAADGTIALVALTAQAEIASADGLRQMDFVELFLGPGRSTINKACEIITGFYLPLTDENQASCFKRIMRPQGVALPILNCAVWVNRKADMVVESHISVGPGGPTPFRGTQAEDVMRGQAMSEPLLAHALDQLLTQAKFRTSALRATAGYRKHIVQGLFKDTFITAWKRAGK
jgi:xanthine dehydrogenase FAD-binding subunit